MPTPAQHGTTGPGGAAGRRVVVCVTGGIAAYKAADLTSRLVQAGDEVRVVMTEASQRFVTPTTFGALTGHPVTTSVWSEHHGVSHVELATWAGVVVVAPCTMDCIARLAHGRADDAVTLLVAAVDRARAPVLLAPAMNTVMWSQASTQRNVAQLREDGFLFVGPGKGWQACRHSGEGRMAEVDEIIQCVRAL